MELREAQACCFPAALTLCLRTNEWSASTIMACLCKDEWLVASFDCSCSYWDTVMLLMPVPVLSASQGGRA